METINLPSVSKIASGDNLDYSEVALRDTSNNSEIAKGNSSHDSAVKKVYDKKYAPLYKAVRHGDLEDVMKFLEARPEGVNAIISEIGETALHLAVTFEHLHIVKELVNKMQEGDLEWRNKFGETALVIATCTGIIEMAKCMIEKNKNLPMIPTNSGTLPVTQAVVSNQKEMARYLYSATPLEELVPEKGYHGANFLRQCFLSDAIDFAMDLLRYCPRLAITLNERNSTLLWSLANRPSKFPSGCRLVFWKRWIYNWIQIEPATATKEIRINIERSNARGNNDMMSKVPNKYHGIKRIYKLKLTHVMSLELLRITCNEIATLDDLSQLSNADEFQSLFQAAENGIPEFIIELLNVNPSCRVDQNELGRNFFFHAIQYRQAKVFNLIYGVTSSIRDDLANVKDNSNNTALHMAALLAPSTQLNRIPGAALQMQRELQWFKEVEHVITPSKCDSVNNDGDTAV
ncbi:hypothetical protein L6164_008762 [Bauhinia variegata]|uniref:Uncharacterized protein n=1 Tax=Bauhinia variegata TaxID=167791 RepID=A0ACB9PGR9_BAUVA|nr:hypothetical protein L6164_008762 [Bauhinia variegata]